MTKDVELKMQKSLDNYKNNLSKIRTGRAHAGILDHVVVDYYGSFLPVSQVANVSVTDVSNVAVQPWEAKMLSVIEKAIRESDLGLNPVVNGPVIRVPMPPLTEERRRELAKVVKTESEDAKVVIRNIRRDANNDLKNELKDKLISEDDEKRLSNEVQKLTDKYIVEIENVTSIKEKELLTI